MSILSDFFFKFYYKMSIKLRENIQLVAWDKMAYIEIWTIEKN